MSMCHHRVPLKGVQKTWNIATTKKWRISQFVQTIFCYVGWKSPVNIPLLCVSLILIPPPHDWKRDEPASASWVDRKSHIAETTFFSLSSRKRRKIMMKSGVESTLGKEKRKTLNISLQLYSINRRIKKFMPHDEFHQNSQSACRKSMLFVGMFQPLAKDGQFLVLRKRFLITHSKESEKERRKNFRLLFCWRRRTWRTCSLTFDW